MPNLQLLAMRMELPEMIEHIDWRTLVTRDEDPEYLAGTEVDVPAGWGDDYERFVASLVGVAWVA